MKDFIKLIKLRLTLLVVFSASISFVIGSKVNGPIDWSSWDHVE
jgi:protoheme IX farnesyltransferase